MTTQAPVSYAIGRYLGLPGSITRYFWVQVIYPSGRSVVSNLVQIDNAGSLTSQNQINIQWAPAPGAIGYDVVETPTSSAPTLNSPATIGVALGLTDSSLTLSAEPTLVSWTYETGNGTVGADIDIGTTQITSGTDGSILLQQSGLVAENPDITWDDTTGLTLGKPVHVTGDSDVTGDFSVTGALSSDSVEVLSGGDLTISTGVGSVKMSTANAATNVAWVPITYAGTVYYVPVWTTNAP